jgi:hypothetical protein
MVGCDAGSFGCVDFLASARFINDVGFGVREEAELDLWLELGGRDQHHEIRFWAHASGSVLELFKTPPLLFVCFVLCTVHSIYLLVEKYLDYGVF